MELQRVGHDWVTNMFTFYADILAYRFSSGYFWLFNFLEEFVYNWYYFFLKCLVEFTSEATWAWIFLCGKYFDYNFNVSNRIGYLFFLEWTLVICIFQGICPFFKVVEFGDIKLFVMFPIPYL